MVKRTTYLISWSWCQESRQGLKLYFSDADLACLLSTEAAENSAACGGEFLGQDDLEDSEEKDGEKERRREENEEDEEAIAACGRGTIRF
ncbi:hypothetical protein MRB53_024101 [Persea americana]|uniref:Uncharacterized protein n=1 Tax=Persea americana TaxID=3435 RepID=A0ACC2LCF9_PERAE|nr:hypothetical protein MRB53_024101 [Persea americana]